MKTKHRLRCSHIDQQQFGVEDEQEGQQRGPDIIGKALNAGLDRVALRDRRCREGSQSDRWCVICQDAEIEDETSARRSAAGISPSEAASVRMTGAMRGRHDNIVSRSSAAPCPGTRLITATISKHDHQVTARGILDQFTNDLMRAGQRKSCQTMIPAAPVANADPDHVSRAGNHTVYPLGPAPCASRTDIAVAAHHRLQRIAGSG